MKLNMKKWILDLIVFLTIAALMSGCAASQSPQSVEQAYRAIQEKLEADAMTEEEYRQAYIEILGQIASGKAEEAKAYATILREMTQNEIVFEDGEVFSVAGKLSQIYKDAQKGKNSFGWESITAETDSKGAVAIKIAYVDISGYSVRNMAPEDGEQHADQEIPYDGALGKNRIQITLHDAGICDALKERYAQNTVYSMEGVPEGYLFKWIYNSDHGIVLYIGSDHPLQAEEETKDLASVLGVITVRLNNT